MGCFNLTCAITRTPITDKDECVVLLFKQEAAERLRMDSMMGLRWELDNNFVDVYYGIYEGYGRVSKCPVDNLTDTNQYLVIPISKHAWDFGINLSKSDKNKHTIEGIDREINAHLAMQKLQETAKKLSKDIALAKELEKTVDLLYKVNWIGFGAEFKVLICLNIFMYQNNINLFDVTPYGGQSMNYNEMKEWENLRNVRIEYLKSKIEE